MEAFLKSGHFTNRGPKFFLAAIEEARKAVKLAPDFPEAHWALARTLHGPGVFAFKPFSEVLPEARAEIRRALELDPNLVQAHALLGWSYFIADHNWEEAEPWLQKSFQRSPALIGSQYGLFLSARGRHEEAIAAGRKAVESDPLNPWALASLGRCYHHIRRYEEAAAWARKALALDGEFDYAMSVLGWSLFQQGKLTEAFEYCIRGRWNEGLQGEMRAAFQSGGWDAAWRVRQSKVESSSRSAHEKLRVRMQTALYLRDGNQITETVEQMEKDGDAWLAQLQDPLLDPARGNPRFKALLKRLRYPEQMWK
jgi:serine/threonine-protein kinase